MAGCQLAMAQNGPISDHTTSGEAWTSTLRDRIAAEAGCPPRPIRAMAQTAAGPQSAGMILCVSYMFFMGFPFRVGAGIDAPPRPGGNAHGGRMPPVQELKLADT